LSGNFKLRAAEILQSSDLSARSHCWASWLLAGRTVRSMGSLPAAVSAAYRSSISS